MKNKYWRVGRRFVNIVKRGLSSLSKLLLRPASDDTDPLRWGRPPCLLLEHAHRVGERRDAVPPKLHVEIEATADEMHVRIIETRNNCTLIEIDRLGLWTAKSHDFAVRIDSQKRCVMDGDSLDHRPRRVHRSDVPVVQDQIRRRSHVLLRYR